MIHGTMMEDGTHSGTTSSSVSCRQILTLVTIWISVIATLPPASSSQLITVTSTVPPGEITLCPGRQILFTCVTRGSVVIGWSSNEYIGVGDQLEYSVGQSLDVTQRGVIDSNTIASFINDTDDNGTPVLVSQLRIIVSSISSTPSVTCIHGSNNIRNISTFQVLVDPGILRVTARLTKDVRGECTLYVSFIAPDNIDIVDITKFLIYINGINELNETSSNNDTLISLSYFIRSCDPLNVSVGAINHCGREGRPSPNTTVIAEPLCVDSICVDVSPSTGNFSTVLGTLLGVFVVLFVAAIVGWIISVVIIKSKKPSSVGAQEGLSKQIEPK